MALERRIAIAVFAVGVVIVLVALFGCGDSDDGASTPAPAPDPPSVELPKGCDGKTSEIEYEAQRQVEDTGKIRLVYFSSGSITPCSARLEDSKLVLTVLEPDIATMDLRPHCAEVDLGDPEAAAVVEDGATGVSTFDEKAAEAELEGDCTPVPLLD